MFKNFKLNRSVLLLTLLFALILLATSGYLVVSKKDSASTNPTAPATKPQKTEGDRIKEYSAGNSSSPSTTTTPKVSNSPTPSGNASTAPATKPQPVDLTVTSTTQTTNSWQIRVKINALTDQGNCTLTMMQGTKTITRSAGVQPFASFSSCKGFDIPLSSVSKGRWTVQITFNDSAQNLVGTVRDETTIN